jgi:L-asparaginase / beta-aspartyl-peptidase
MSTIAIALHAGAGEREDLSEKQEQEYCRSLEEALEAGHKVLRDKGTALDAVEAAIRSLEDNPLFNAGRGSAMDFYGRFCMDAAMMCGHTCKAGAVTRLLGVRNPIAFAHCILRDHDHVFLSDEEAREFAIKHNMQFEPGEYFFTRKQFDRWIEAQRKERGGEESKSKKKSFGTVGAVALDADGNLAAGTSTGGIENSRYGRISDSCVIGGGTFADNPTCAVSCTGTGEHIIRAVLAHEVSALMEHTGCTLHEAAQRAIDEKIRKRGGEAGLVAVDRHGNIEMPFSAERMYRASRKNNDDMFVALY